ncbi:MAG: UDP-N-acetylmuramoyl-L-alanine--D-glutamate ligase [Ruminococcaceae bacterium]|nr:UDP-N-acetylmuramoyl-L-alanine--D-glutamate ligase [Oscillospiraceae bacterium]
MFENLCDFKSKVKGKRINVVGLGVSNIPLVKMLTSFGAYVIGRDKNENINLDLPIEYKLGENYLSDLEGDYLFKSPGIRPDLPEFLEFIKKGGIVTSEMEVFFDLCPCKIIAVTGSDGKTTTTTLISEMLKDKGYNVYLGGNIGKPLLSEVEEMKKDDIAVVELSSFQLMTMKKSPSVAVITNIAPNHLDVHKSFEEYILAKENICKFQKTGDRLIVNYDNEITNKTGQNANGEVLYFSLKGEYTKDAYYKDGAIYLNSDKLIDIKDIKIPGMHNVDNYMAAYLAVKDFITVDNFINVCKNFGGVSHRIEFVKEENGVKYYNDSIASSPSRTMACLNAFYSEGKKIILIAGGKDKGLDYTELGMEIAKKTKKVYLVGDLKDPVKNTAEAIKKAVLSYDENFPVEILYNLKDTVKKVKEDAKAGDIVVLSPAGTSFDKYKNFEERGNLFKECVKNG